MALLNRREHCDNVPSTHSRSKTYDNDQHDRHQGWRECAHRAGGAQGSFYYVFHSTNTHTETIDTQINVMTLFFREVTTKTSLFA